MRTLYRSLSLKKALAGTVLFVGIDSISLVLFESPLIIATVIGYSCIITAARSVVAQIFAALAVFLVAFLQGNFSWHLAGSTLVLWLFIFFYKAGCQV